MRRADALRVVRPRAGANPRRPGGELLLTFAFRCNFACRFCYVEDGLGGRFRGVTLDEARRLLSDPLLTAGVTRIVLSGGEVTLDQDLPRFAELARAVPSVEHVRIQTNASRLDRALVARLTTAGVDEYFVSLHGADAATCDAITAVPGSFAAIEGGIAALAEAGVTIVTNTVVCSANVGQLDRIVGLAHARGARGAELWGYVPRVDAADARGQMVRVSEAGPHLQRAVAVGLARGLAMTVKYFPRCLLGDLAHVHSDAQPRLIIDDAFWQDYPTYGCLYEGVCADAAVDDGCSGLADAYVHRFGWEEDALRPRGPGADVAVEVAPVARYHGWDDRPHVASPARALDLTRWDLGVGAVLAGFRLDSAAATVGGIRLVFVDDRGTFAIDLHRHDPDRACFARTASLDLTHPPLSADATARARPLFAAVVARLRAHDHGALAGELTAAAVAPPRPGPPTISLLPPAWPGATIPAAAALLIALDGLVATGRLAAAEIEPSLALATTDALRLLINPSVAGPGRDRPAIAAQVLAGAGAPGWLIDVATGWLAEPGRSAFVGVALMPETPARVKLYLGTRDAYERAAAAAALGGPPASATTELIAIDAIADRAIGRKHYAPITAATARAEFDGALLDLLERRGLMLGELRLLAATRFTVDGAVRDRALHVDVTRFAHLGLGPAWARACGDADVAARIAASGRCARVLSTTAGTDRARHVYLGGPP